MRAGRWRFFSALMAIALVLASTAVAAAPGVPANLAPAPAELQTGDQWVLPDLAGDGWVVLAEEPRPGGAQPPGGQPPSGQPPQQEPGGPLVVGYYAEDWVGDVRALNALQAAGEHVDRVVNFALQLNADGSITTRSYPELSAEAGELGVPVYGLVHNMADGMFSADVARSVLADPARRSRAVAEMLQIARAHGLDGIDIDIENVPGDLRPFYTALVEEAAAVLKRAGLGLTVSVPAKVWEDTTSNWGGAFDYAALGRLADQVAVMAYDEHSYSLPAGPVASLPWVDRVAAYATTQIPAEKILLGIPAYGYDWVAGTTRVVRGLSTAGAYSLASKHGAAIQRDDVAQVPFFTYTQDGVDHVVYFENSRSAAAKLGVVKKYGLAGIAIWRLGLNEPAIWDPIAAALQP